MRIGIIGGGSIGLLLASYFMPFHHVTLYVRRQEQKEVIEKAGLQLYVQSNKEATLAPTIEHIDDLQQLDAYDCIFICVKQTQLPALLEKIQDLPKEIPLLFLQNGMGHLESLDDLRHESYVGVVEHGAKRMSDHQVNHLGHGRIVLAPYRGKETILQQLVRSLDQERFPVLQQEHWESLLEGKLLVNAVINPLTALFDVANGEIIENRYIQQLARQLCEEVALALEVDPEISWQRVQTIAMNTKHNTSSMRADLLKNGETEIQAINGYLANKYPNLPLNQWIYISMLALTERGRK